MKDWLYASDEEVNDMTFEEAKKIVKRLPDIGLKDHVIKALEVILEKAEKTEPVVHAHWVDRYSGKYANPVYDCSECKRRAAYKFENDSLHIGLWVQDLTDYCPNCGAKMDEDGDINENYT